MFDGKKQREKFLNRGVIGVAAKRKEVVFTSKPLNDVDYNSNIDIETTLPLLTIPLIDDSTQDNFVLGIIQVMFVLNFYSIFKFFS